MDSQETPAGLIKRPASDVHIVFFTLIFIIVSFSSGAQDFGKVKVQYEEFDFSILNTPHFSIYYYTEAREAISDVADIAASSSPPGVKRQGRRG